jgi:DHA2 family multidrug resistance protein
MMTFIPIAGLSLSTLPKSQMAIGAGVHSLSKCVVTSFTISIANALVARFSQVHQTYLVKNLSIYNSTFQHRIALLSCKLMNYYPSLLAGKKVNGLLYRQLLQQAKLSAFVDIFQNFALVAFLLVPLAFLLKTARKTA